MKKIDVIKKIYDELGFDDPNLFDDVMNDVLSEHVSRSGQHVIWYADDVNEIAIYIDTGEILSGLEIISELC